MLLYMYKYHVLLYIVGAVWYSLYYHVEGERMSGV